MKKVISLLLTVFLLSCPPLAFASENPEAFNIEFLAAEFLSDTLVHNDCFDFSVIEGKTLYLCKPIHPSYLQGDTFVENQEIEYYLIKTDDAYIANITVCYDGERFLSAAFSTDIAQALVANNIGSSDIALVPYNGTLYIKTSNSVISGSTVSSSRIAQVSSDNCLTNNFVEQVQSTPCDLSPVEPRSVLQLPSTTPVIPRSIRILNVPYVSQGEYDICWAAAAGALGQYHTGISYTATELCDKMGVGYFTNDMNMARQLLSKIYGLSTTYKFGKLSTNVIINRLNEQKPILVGFSNNDHAHMVVLCGFDYPSTTSYLKYYFRDSNRSSLTTVITLPDAEVILDYYSDMGYLFWTEAAYKS